MVAIIAVHPETAWDSKVNPACCPYPEHDPRDYNWPYSHFLYSQVIPDVVGSFVSMTELNITYQYGQIVSYGKRIAPSALSTVPAIRFSLKPDRAASAFHTLMMVDPDAPYRDSPADGELLLWLVYDIPGNDVSLGQTLVGYTAPEPQPCPSDDKFCLPEHRVTFLLWEQPHGPLLMQPEDLLRRSGSKEVRQRFRARDFASRHRLGLQIAMNFFETSHADPLQAPWWHVSDSNSISAVADSFAQHEEKSTQIHRDPWKEEL